MLPLNIPEILSNDLFIMYESIFYKSEYQSLGCLSILDYRKIRRVIRTFNTKTKIENYGCALYAEYKNDRFKVEGKISIQELDFNMHRKYCLYF